MGGPVSAIVFYEAPPGATVYDKPNIFFPLNFTTQLRLMSGVGELSTTPRVRTPWGPPGGPDGQDVHGSEDDFMGLTIDTGPVDWEDVPSCRVPPTVGLRADAPAFTGQETGVALSLGTLARAGMALRSEGAPPAYKDALAFKAVTGGQCGLALASRGSPPLGGLCGLALGVHGELPRSDTCGLALASRGSPPLGGICGLALSVIQGVVVGATDGLALKVESGSSEMHEGIALASIGDGAGSGVGGRVGLAFGTITGDLIVDDPPEDPGTPCSNAGRWGPFGERSFTVSSGANLWLYHLIDPLAIYSVKLYIDSGSISGVHVWWGNTCGDSSDVFTLSSNGQCNAHGAGAPGSATTIWIQILGGLFGSGNIRVKMLAGGSNQCSSM